MFTWWCAIILLGILILVAINNKLFNNLKKAIKILLKF